MDVTEIIQVPGHPPGRNRAVYYLKHSDGFVNVEAVFGNTRKAANVELKKLLYAIGLWIGGHDNQPAHHHGFDKTAHDGQFVDCHVLKGNQDRVYGFKYNPNPANKGYQVLVLIRHIKKAQQETPITELRKVLRTANLDEVKEAIQAIFRKKGGQ